jgi:hypothetical protein
MRKFTCINAPYRNTSISEYLCIQISFVVCFLKKGSRREKKRENTEGVSEMAILAKVGVFG